MVYGNVSGIQQPGSLTPQNVLQKGLQVNQLEVTPFQMFLDEAVEALAGISAMEHKTNELIKKYLRGKVSIDEVVHETGKLNLAMTMATTVISNFTETFKNLQAMSL